jgi:hypothetical protein
MGKSGHSCVGFGGQCVAISWHGSQALELIDFLCCDLQRDSDYPPRAEFKLTVDHGQKVYALQNVEQQLYQGDDYYELAYTLINEIIYHVIVDKKDGLAIHAAALSSAEGGILLPGKSGSGKSTFSAWLVSCGCHYLTDELVFLDGLIPIIYPFTRPVSFKKGSLPVLNTFAHYNQGDVIAGQAGLMLPHRLLNVDFTSEMPLLSLVLFPNYVGGALATITRISAGLGCARLMECYVNARNIDNHGIDRLANIARTTPIYQLTYGSFDGLYETLQSSFPLHFHEK